MKLTKLQIVYVLYLTIFVANFYRVDGGRRLGLLFMKKGYYATNHEERRDPPGKTILYYRLAALLGNRTAKINLGVFYAYGRGVPKNEQKAVALFEEILRKDPMGANICVNLGIMYHYGRGVEANPSNAFILFQRGAWGGQAIAQQYLAQYYETGLNGNENLEEAYAWYLFAHANGAPRAHARLHQMQNWLDPGQRKRAEHRSFELAAKFPASTAYTLY